MWHIMSMISFFAVTIVEETKFHNLGAQIEQCILFVWMCVCWDVYCVCGCMWGCLCVWVCVGDVCCVCVEMCCVCWGCVLGMWGVEGS